jgi:hypothetical protein
MAKIITHLVLDDFKDPDSYPKDPQNIMCQIRSAGGVLDYSTTCPTFRATESVRPGGICASNELAHVLDLHFEIARGPRGPRCFTLLTTAEHSVKEKSQTIVRGSVWTLDTQRECF